MFGHIIPFSLIMIISPYGSINSFGHMSYFDVLVTFFCQYLTGLFDLDKFKMGDENLLEFFLEILEKIWKFYDRSSLVKFSCCSK